MDNHVYGDMNVEAGTSLSGRNSMSETVAIDSNGDNANKLVNPITDQSTISSQ